MSELVDGAVRAAGTVPHEGRAAELATFLSEPERLAALLPNVEGFTPGADGTFDVTLRPSFGLGEVPVRTSWRPAGPLAWEVSGTSGEHQLTLRCAVTIDEQAAHWTIECHTFGALRAMTQRTLAAILGFQATLVLRAALNRSGDPARSSGGPARDRRSSREGPAAGGGQSGCWPPLWSEGCSNRPQ